jgi:hypothetical protein
VRKRATRLSEATIEDTVNRERQLATYCAWYFWQQGAFWVRAFVVGVSAHLLCCVCCVCARACVCAGVRNAPESNAAPKSFTRNVWDTIVSTLPRTGAALKQWASEKGHALPGAELHFVKRKVENTKGESRPTVATKEVRAAAARVALDPKCEADVFSTFLAIKAP